MKLLDRVFREPAFDDAREALRQKALNAESIEATNISEWVQANRRDGESLGSMCVRCIPPFERSFVEWRESIPTATNVGVLVDRAPQPNGVAGWIIQCSVWLGRANDVVVLPIDMHVTVDGEGVPDWDRLSTEAQPWVDDAEIDEQAADRMLSVFMQSIGVALVAFRFMHCKNVTLAEHQQPRAERRREERAGNPPLVRYRTIDIAPAVRRLSVEGSVEQVGVGRALHLCRGHFADYTDGAGLFGKYKVSVFVPEHVRGSASRGAVVKDYRVGPQEGA